MAAFSQESAEQAAHRTGTDDRYLHIFSPVWIEYCGLQIEYLRNFAFFIYSFLLRAQRMIWSFLNDLEDHRELIFNLQFSLFNTQSSAII